MIVAQQKKRLSADNRFFTAPLQIQKNLARRAFGLAAGRGIGWFF